MSVVDVAEYRIPAKFLAQQPAELSANIESLVFEKQKTTEQSQTIEVEPRPIYTSVAKVKTQEQCEQELCAGIRAISKEVIKCRNRALREQ